MITNRNKKKIWFFLAAFLVLAFAVFSAFSASRLHRQVKESNDPYGFAGTAACLKELQIKFLCGGSNQIINLWIEGTPEDGMPSSEENASNGYFFLPGGTDSNSVSFYFSKEIGKLQLDGRPLNSGEAIGQVEMEQPYKLTLTGRNGDEDLTVFFMQSSSIPAMFITNDGGDLAYLREEKSHRDTGTMKLIRPDGTVDYDGLLDDFGGRGNATWNFQKKPWGFKIEHAAPLLDMDAAEKWVLFANASDDSKGLRNKAVYDMAAECGMEYTSELTWVDLYLNGTYAGLYQLCEKIDVAANRVNIGDLNKENEAANFTIKLDPDELKQLNEKHEGGPSRRYSSIETPSDYSGGYILERNYGYKLTDKDYYFITDRDDGFVVRYPSVVSRTETDYIADSMQRVENALFAPDGIDPDSGKYYLDLIDLQSWAAKYLVEEISKNEGAGATSAYFHKKKGNDKIYAGPVWDYDKALGRWMNLTSPLGLTNCLTHYQKTEWWLQFYQKPEAYEEIVRQYETSFRPYLTDLLPERLISWADSIQSAWAMDYVRWHDEITERIYPRALPTEPGKFCLDASCAYIQNWIRERVDFLDSVWLYDETWYTVHSLDEGNADTEEEYLYVRPGAALGDCLALAEESAVNYWAEEYGEERILDHWISDTGDVLKPDTLITRNMEIEAVWK